MIKLSILIPTLPVRKAMYEKLWEELKRQAKPYGEEIEIISWDEVRASIGAKRNALLGWAKGNYVCFVDDDDRVADNYIDLLMEGIKKDVDCCSLKGKYSVDGEFEGYFEHSIKYHKWETVDFDKMIANYEKCPVKYLRMPNHLNCIKASIAKQFRFPETNHGEDHDWSKKVHESGLLKTEHYIEQVIYYYDYKTKKDY